MFQITIQDVCIFLLSFFGGGGLGMIAVKLFIKNEAKEAVKEDIKELKQEDDSLHKRINWVEKEYVTCKYCNMQHQNLATTLSSMDRKLDILIDKKGGK
jgi:hypothetical protein